MGPSRWDTSSLDDWGLVAETFDGSIVDAASAQAADGQQVDWLEMWEGWTNQPTSTAGTSSDGGPGWHEAGWS